MQASETKLLPVRLPEAEKRRIKIMAAHWVQAAKTQKHRPRTFLIRHRAAHGQVHRPRWCVTL